VLLLQVGRGSDHQRAKRRLLINGATPRKGDEALAMAAEAVEEGKLQKKNISKTSVNSSKEGEGIAYQIYKKAGDWWKCVFLHAGDETFVCILHFEGHFSLY
jgi:predicted GNAT family acetyltransferase